MRHLALTVSGRDRARSRVVEVPLPDPGEDNGQLISHLVLGQAAEEIERQYTREQAVVFLEESGFDLDRIPAPADCQPQGAVTRALRRQRRILSRSLCTPGYGTPRASYGNPGTAALLSRPRQLPASRHRPGRPPGTGLIRGCFDMPGVTAAAHDEIDRVLRSVREALADTSIEISRSSTRGSAGDPDQSGQ